jgi:hypothetical protein
VKNVDRDEMRFIGLGVRLRVWVCSPLAIPNVQAVRPAHGLGARKSQPQQDTQSLASGVCPQLSPGCGHGLSGSSAAARSAVRCKHGLDGARP